MTINRKNITEDYITFEEFNTMKPAIGQILILPMGGPWSVKRFVVSRVDRNLLKPDMVTCFARAIVTYKCYEANVVTSKVTHCGKVVAEVVYDEVADLYYVGTDLTNNSSPVSCGGSLEKALEDFFN